MTSICIANIAVPTWKNEYDLINKTIQDIQEPQSEFDLDSAEACEALMQRHNVFIELSKQVELRITTRIRRLESLLAQWKHVIGTLKPDNGLKEILYLIAPQTYLRAALSEEPEETSYVLDVGANVNVEFKRSEVLAILGESTEKLTPILENFMKLKDISIRRKTRCEVSMGRIRQSFANAQKELQMLEQQQQLLASRLAGGGGVSLPSTIKEDDAES